MPNLWPPGSKKGSGVKKADVKDKELQYPPPQDDREDVKRCMKVLDPKLAVHVARQTTEEGEDELLVTQEKVKTLAQQTT